jgi:hypothetical protein
MGAGGNNVAIGGAQVWKSNDSGLTWGLLNVLDIAKEAAIQQRGLKETHEAGELIATGRIGLGNGGANTATKWQTVTTTSVAGDVFYSEDFTRGYQHIESWEVFNAEQVADSTNGVFAHRGIVYATGPRSIERNYNQADPENPWAVSDPALPYGVLAPDSWVSWDELNLIFYLTSTDNVIQVVQFEGLIEKQMSAEYAAILNDRTVVTQPELARAWAVAIRGMPHYVITFPADALTICYNLQKRHWWRWALWDGNNYGAATIHAYAYWRAQNVHLIGDYRPNGRIYTMNGLTDNGDIIRYELTSGHVGNYSRNPAGRQIYNVKRGQTVDETVPIFTVQKRDDGRKDFGPPRPVSLGATDDNEFFGHLNRCGSYRKRQMRIVHEDAKSNFIFVGMDES